MCRLVSGRDPSSRGRGATGSKAWTASAIISSAFAGHGAGWWWKTPSWCTWTETKAGSTLCCCLTQSSKWKWAVPTQTPNMESASRTSLGRSAVRLQRTAYLCLALYCDCDACVACLLFVQEPDHQMQQLQTGSLVESWNQPAGRYLRLSQRATLWRVRSATGEYAHEMVRHGARLRFTAFHLQISFPFAKPVCFTVVVWRYVNGSGYFADLADALEQAKEEIFITDWW